jgi:hypothetical protein
MQERYGSAQSQNGLLQYHRFPLDLWDNTEAAVPFFMTSAG